MNIRINGMPLDFELENERTVGEVMAQLERLCESNGMTVTSVRSGGREIVADELDDFFAADINAVEDLEIQAISGVEILDMAEKAGGELARLSLSLQDIPVLLQTGRGRQAMDIVAELSGQMEKLCYLLPLLPLAGIPEETLSIEEMNPGAYLAAISPFMKEVTEAIALQDTVTIGDISEYEIAPRMLEIANFLLRITGASG